MYQNFEKYIFWFRKKTLPVYFFGNFNENIQNMVVCGCIYFYDCQLQIRKHEIMTTYMFLISYIILHGIIVFKKSKTNA